MVFKKRIFHLAILFLFFVTSAYATDYKMRFNPHTGRLDWVVADSSLYQPSDDVYGASWDGSIYTAPSQNAIYDKIEALVLEAGVTAWDDIGDPDGDTAIALDTYKTVFSSTIDGENTSVLMIENTDTDLDNEVVLLTLQHTDDGSINGTFLEARDNNGDLVWKLGADGKMTIGPGAADYILPTARGAANTFLMDNGGGAVAFTALTDAHIPDDITASVAYDDIGDPDAAGSISFADGETATYTTLQDSDTFMTLANTASLGQAIYMLDVTYNEDDGIYGHYIRCREDMGGTPNTVFQVGPNGAVTTDGGVTALGTIEGATLTEGGNAVYNATEVPGGELGGTWASPTIDDVVTVTDWTLISPVATDISVTGATLTGNIDFADLTVSEILALDASGYAQTLAVATYPSLTELSYVKGLASAVQTQLTKNAIDEKGFLIEHNNTGETFANILMTSTASTITRVTCYTYTGTTDINFTDGGNDVLSSDLVCNVGGQTSCAAGCDVDTIETDYDNLEAFTPDALVIVTSTVGNTTTIHVSYTKD